MTAPGPMPARLSRTAIDEYTARILAAHGMDGIAQVDVQGLVRKLGGCVEVQHGPAALCVYGPGDFEVYLLMHASRMRDRFVVSVALGYYFLHYRLPGLAGKVLFPRNPDRRVAIEANLFASALLMPADQFGPAWSLHRGDVGKVAVAFDVSLAAARTRAQVLGLSRSSAEAGYAAPRREDRRSAGSAGT